MTLLITECSAPGVVMAEDSAITKIDGKGRIREIDQQGWLKVLKVPKVQAAIGYWGFIGRIHSGRFDDWLNRSIGHATYSDLPSLAASIAEILNKACHNKPLNNNECAGVHVAGFHVWDDGERRPFLFHVHNGHGHVGIEYVTEPLPEGIRLVEVRTRPVNGPRSLFEEAAGAAGMAGRDQGSVDPLKQPRRGYDLALRTADQARTDFAALDDAFRALRHVP